MIARAALGELGPVDKDRSRRQHRRQQAAPGQGARTDIHAAYCAPPLNQRAIRRRSASVMWVMLPGGITRETQTCWSIIAARARISSCVSKITPLGGAAKPSCVGFVAWQGWQRA